MNTSSVLEQTKHLLKDEPYLIGGMVGFKDLTELHNVWLKDFLYGSEDTTILAHRGSYKTTCLALALALNIIVHPEENIIFCRKTDDDVTEVIRLVLKILRSGAVRKVCMILRGCDLLITKDTNDEIETILHKGQSGASQILGLGIGGSLTGKHADVVITDDIVNIKDRVSPAERDRTKLMYQELQNIKNRGGRIINTGTPWHKDDAISMMPNVKRYDCYHTGLMTQEDIGLLRDSMSSSLFAANYELKHIADKDAMFFDPEYTDDTEKIYNGIAHIDAAYGGEDATAFTVIKETEGLLFVYGKKYDRHVEECLDDILQRKQRYRAGTTWCESNADKGYLARSLISKGDLASTYHEKMNKHIKISTYLKENWRRVRFISDTDPEYVSQILDYTENAVHDDCPDSLASAIRQLTKGIVKIQTFKGGI